MDTPRIADAALGMRHVFLRDMVLGASIGVHAHEHEARQRIRINLDLSVDDDGTRSMSRSAPSIGADELGRVVDYEVLANMVRSLVADGHVRLVETIAERIAEACLLDRRVAFARVRVEKLDIFPDATSAGVEIERRRS